MTGPVERIDQMCVRQAVQAMRRPALRRQCLRSSG
jgi:hypothetical protein